MPPLGTARPSYPSLTLSARGVCFRAHARQAELSQLLGAGASPSRGDAPPRGSPASSSVGSAGSSGARRRRDARAAAAAAAAAAEADARGGVERGAGVVDESGAGAEQDVAMSSPPVNRRRRRTGDEGRRDRPTEAPGGGSRAHNAVRTPVQPVVGDHGIPAVAAVSAARAEQPLPRDVAEERRHTADLDGSLSPESVGSARLDSGSGFVGDESVISDGSDVRSGDRHRGPEGPRVARYKGGSDSASTDTGVARGLRMGDNLAEYEASTGLSGIAAYQMKITALERQLASAQAETRRWQQRYHTDMADAEERCAGYCRQLDAANENVQRLVRATSDADDALARAEAERDHASVRVPELEEEVARLRALVESLATPGRSAKRTAAEEKFWSEIATPDLVRASTPSGQWVAEVGEPRGSPQGSPGSDLLAAMEDREIGVGMENRIVSVDARAITKAAEYAELDGLVPPGTSFGAPRGPTATMLTANANARNHIRQLKREVHDLKNQLDAATRERSDTHRLLAQERQASTRAAMRVQTQLKGCVRRIRYLVSERKAAAQKIEKQTKYITRLESRLLHDTLKRKGGVARVQRAADAAAARLGKESAGRDEVLAAILQQDGNGDGPGPAAPAAPADADGRGRPVAPPRVIEQRGRGDRDDGPGAPAPADGALVVPRSAERRASEADMRWAEWYRLKQQADSKPGPARRKTPPLPPPTQVERPSGPIAAAKNPLKRYTAPIDPSERFDDPAGARAVDPATRGGEAGRKSSGGAPGVDSSVVSERNASIREELEELDAELRMAAADLEVPLPVDDGEAGALVGREGHDMDTWDISESMDDGLGTRKLPGRSPGGSTAPRSPVQMAPHPHPLSAYERELPPEQKRDVAAHRRRRSLSATPPTGHPLAGAAKHSRTIRRAAMAGQQGGYATSGAGRQRRAQGDAKRASSGRPAAVGVSRGRGTPGTPLRE